jgi:hypothetical protein
MNNGNVPEDIETQFAEHIINTGSAVDLSNFNSKNMPMKIKIALIENFQKK